MATEAGMTESRSRLTAGERERTKAGEGGRKPGDVPHLWLVSAVLERQSSRSLAAACGWGMSRGRTKRQPRQHGRLARKQMETAALEHTVGRQPRAARGDYEPSMAPVPRPAVVRTDEFQYFGMQEMEAGGVAGDRKG
jgi:hypothetical protein